VDKDMMGLVIYEGHINGLRSLILQENPLAHYVHYFAHQLQLTLVAVTSGHPHIKGFL